MTIWLAFPFVAVLTFLLTGLLLNYAPMLSLLDVPNARSSHTTPTPRGGGGAIVLTCLVALSLLGGNGWIPAASMWALIGAGGLVALVGLLDDLGHVPVRWRLIAHFAGAVWALICMRGLPPLVVFGTVWNIGWLGHGLAAVYLVWLLNLYNFMDGIDGIAGIEGLTVCLGGALLFALSSATGLEWIVPVLIMAALTGFLFWNFPRAKIFMGDVGSGFLGMTFGVLSIRAAWMAPELFWAWLIMLGAFIVDATVTLIRRVRRGEPFYTAHRSHAYQYASRKFGAHHPVSLAFGAINLFWLLPVASLVVVGRLDGLLGVCIAWLPMIFLAMRFKAGATELQDV